MKPLLTMAAVVGTFVLTSGSAPADTSPRTAYDFSFVAINGEPLPLEQYRGKVMLVVNTASFCGFTQQYEGLQSVWERYRSKGLVVIGVPSNDFGNQEPKSESEIVKFCRGAFGVTFPLTEKSTVKGPDAHPFYAWAAQTLGETGKPRWNFHKYLVGADGRLLAWFSSAVKPTSSKVTEAIEQALSSVDGRGA